MNVEYRLVADQSFLFIGMRQRMSLVKDSTAGLWGAFMPRRNEIQSTADSNFYSVAVYDSVNYFFEFNPMAEFNKWAAVAVSEIGKIPQGFESLQVPPGDFVVIPFVGRASETPSMFQHVYGTWLPSSGFELDERPHLACMPPSYDPNDPKAREEIWIPIKS